MGLLNNLTIAYQEGRFEKNRLQKRKTLCSLVLVGGIENKIASKIMLKTSPRTYIPQGFFERFSYVIGYLK